MSDSVEIYESVRASLLELLVLARAQAWDDLIEVLPDYLAQTAKLPQKIDWDAIPSDEQSILEASLRELQTLQDELTDRMQFQRDELAGSLQGLHNTGRLDKAYRM